MIEVLALVLIQNGIYNTRQQLMTKKNQKKTHTLKLMHFTKGNAIRRIYMSSFK